MSPKPSQTQPSDSDSEGELERQQTALLQRRREEEERLRKEQEELEAKVAEKRRRKEERKRLAEEEAKRKAEELERLAREEAERDKREKEELERAEQIEKERIAREAVYKTKVEAEKRKTKAVGSKRKGAEAVTGDEGPAAKRTKTNTVKAGKGDVRPRPKTTAQQERNSTPGPSNQDDAVDVEGSTTNSEWVPDADPDDSAAGVIPGPRVTSTRREKGKGKEVEKEKIKEKEKTRGNYDEQGQKVKMGGKNECGRCRRLGRACKAQEAENKYACEACNQAKQKCVVPTDADVPEHELMQQLLAEHRMTRTVTISLLNEIRGLRSDIAKRQAESAKTLKGLDKAVGDFVVEFQEFYDRTVKMGHLLDDDVFELAQGKKSEEGANADDSGEDTGNKAGDGEVGDGETGEA